MFQTLPFYCSPSTNWQSCRLLNSFKSLDHTRATQHVVSCMNCHNHLLLKAGQSTVYLRLYRVENVLPHGELGLILRVKLVFFDVKLCLANIFMCHILHINLCKMQHHICKAHNNQSCWFLIQKWIVIGKATWLSVSKKAASRLSNIALKIMFLLKQHVYIMESKWDFTHAGRCNWICCPMVLCWMCWRFILVNLVHCCQLLMSFFGMSLSYISRGLLWHLILCVSRHLTCGMTFRENQKGQRQMPFLWFNVPHGYS